MGKHTEELIVKECKASEFADCDIIFSGLDADVAGDVGMSLRPPSFSNTYSFYSSRYGQGNKIKLI